MFTVETVTSQHVLAYVMWVNNH